MAKFFGTDDKDRLSGGDAKDRILGLDGDDFLFGRGGNDRIDGGAGDDRIAGNRGADKLSGGAGRDEFLFYKADDSTPGVSDLILDFQQGSDHIHFAGYDFQTDSNRLHYVGENQFSGEKGELCFETSLGETTVFVDIDGDKAADMLFRVAGEFHLEARDFAGILVQGETII